MIDAKSENLKIEQFAVDKLVSHAKNVRTHPEAQFAQIAGSISYFGFVNPILLGDEDVISTGHRRFMAAKLLGMKKRSDHSPQPFE